MRCSRMVGLAVVMSVAALTGFWNLLSRRDLVRPDSQAQNL
jgi:hypothetical protein